HDLVDILRLRVGRKRPFELRHALVVDDPVVALGRYEGADVESAAIASSAQLQQARRSRARAVDEHLAPEDGVVDPPPAERPRRREEPEAEREAPPPERAGNAYRKEEIDQRE